MPTSSSKEKDRINFFDCHAALDAASAFEINDHHPPHPKSLPLKGGTLKK
jgi:hypothetical protein